MKKNIFIQLISISPQMDVFYNCTWIYIYIIYIRASSAPNIWPTTFLFFFLSSLDQHILTSTSQAICNSAYNANVKCSVMNHDEKHFSVSHEKRIYSYKCLVSKNISALKVAFKAIFALPLTEYTHRLIKLSAWISF